MLTMAPLGAADLAAARDAVKLYARIERTAEDPLVEELAATALLLCERFCGRIAILRAATEIVPAASAWARLTATPVAAITLVEGLPADGASFVLPADAYSLDIDADGDGWVRVTQPGSAGRARVGYQAGLAADWAGLPEPLRQGVVRLATHLFAHRDAADEAASPAAIAALWRPFRRISLS